MICGRYGGRILLRCTYMEKGHLHAKGLIDVMIVMNAMSEGHPSARRR
jgi:hypothetical protein